MADADRFDVVIVGAGPAGCVLAHRLTEDARRTVALIEAGPDYGPDPAAWPAELRDSTSVWTESHPWGYANVAREDEAALSLPRARLVGGTSTVNGCIWLRGSAADYDGWAALGNPGWSFADLLPCFRRAESDPCGGPLHGDRGPVPVSRAPTSSWTPADRAFVAAAKTLGIPLVDDLNGDSVQSPGVGPTPKNVADGMRMNAAFTYLAPVQDRANLTVIAETPVDRAVIESGRAVAVRTIEGRIIRGEEIVVCGGAYGSPAILLRSGIGPPNHLRDLGLPVVADLPGVGANLLDHPLVNGLMEAAIAPGHEPLGRTFMPLMIKARSRQVSDEIDLHIYQGQSLDDGLGAWILWLSVSLQYARSRGTVRLTSADPTAPLQIDHAHLSDPTDLEALCDGVELANRLVGAAPLAGIITPIPERTLRWKHRDDLRATVKRQVGTTFHPSSSCRMGPANDPLAVVDHRGRVHGVAHLRVVDASILPTGPRCNVHFPTIAVAEKVAATFSPATNA